MTRMISCLFLLLITSESIAQNMDQTQIRSLAKNKLPTAIFNFRDFLALPNDGNYSDQIDINVAWGLKKMKALGLESRVVTSKEIKHVYSEKSYHKNAPWMLFYIQMDGQPVDSLAWFQDSPYQAVLKQCDGDDCAIIPWDRLKTDWNPDWKIFARSASDSKGPAIAFLSALEILNEQKIKPAFNIKVIMDFQEELGSPSLPALVEANKELLKAEAMLIMDGARHLSNLPTLTFGARGIATMTLTVYGGSGDLHSGQYGNYAPNPAFKLARLLAAMKDEDGRVLIPGYYDGVELSEKEKAILNDLPEDESEIIKTLGIAAPEKVGATYQEALQYPSLNIRGMRAAWVGKEVRTLIPAEALAEIDMRLVPETPAERQIALVRKFISDQGFHIVEAPPTNEERAIYPNLIMVKHREGSKPFRTKLDSPLGDWLGSAMDRTFGQGNYVRTRATGGSQPIAPFITTLDIPAISIRIPNPDNSIHAPNENIRLGNFLEGIEMCLGVLTEKLNK
jgi:acetylornithine deacetylase/succinyl-diaminopimelate desuccinylase-like protein